MVMKGMLLVIGMVVAGPLAACGGDGALTKAEYVSELSAMCRDFSAREKVIGEPETVADLVEKGPRIVEAFEKAVLNEVSTLEAPDEIAVQADRLVDLAARQRDVLAGLVDAAEAGDLARVQELASKNRAVNREASSIARDLGAEGCAEA